MRLLSLFVALALVAGCQPRDRRPGLWIRGESIAEAAPDWSFTDDVKEIFVETRTWYGVPHSVTTVCARDGETLYVPSLFRDGGRWPEGKAWTRNVGRDPRVRLGIAGRVYEREAQLVTDIDEHAAVFAAFARKYPFWEELRGKPRAERPKLVFLRMDPRSASGETGGES